MAPESDAVRHAREDYEQAEQVRRQAWDRWAEILPLMSTLREMRERNHIADQLRAALSSRGSQ